MDALERQQRLFGSRARPRGASTLARSLAGLFIALCLGAPASARPADPALEQLGAVAEREVAAGHVPGAVLVVGEQGEVVYRRAFGARMSEPIREPLAADAIFDIASLTKVVGTTTAVMQLVEAGRLDLDRPVAAYWPEFAASGKDAVTVRQLLTHTSGLPADLDLAQAWTGEAEGLARAAAVRSVKTPGSTFLYSDVNFIVLGELVHRLSGEPLDGYLQTHVFRPLRMDDTGFRPADRNLAQIAPTERVAGRLRWGEVQDPTAYRMGGVAGHAGLFSTADDLARFATMLLNGGALEGARVLKPETVKLMTTPARLPGGVRRALGWDVSSPYSTGMDVAFGPAGFGHTGYTGCLLWIDPASRRFLIVLSSRLYPDGRGDVRPLRRELAQLIAQTEPAAVGPVERIPSIRGLSSPDR